MAPLLWASAMVTLIIVATFLPFVPGGHDPLAVPLSAISWALGRIGLVLVPIAGLWLRDSTRRASRPAPPRWLLRLTLGASIFITLVTTLVTFASSNSQVLAAVIAAFLGLLTIRLRRRFRATQAAAPMSRMAAAMLVIAPIFVLAAQTILADAFTIQARNRAIGNAAPLIAEIERHRARRGAYPESLFSIWGDYKPAVVGVERYHYERSGEAYNVIFKEPSVGFGIRRFVVYNPLDKQRVTVHEQDRLLLDDAGLDADNAGYTLIEPLPQAHWKVFSFLS
jgi:uncharacterized membrane protein YdcZ (DUF606 family)